VKLAVPKFRLAASVGVYLSDAAVTWCVLEKSPLGTRQADAGEEPCVKQDWGVALDRILTRVKERQGAAAFVVVGLPASHTFFATLPAAGKNESAEQLLAGNHCCTSIPPAELSADMLAVKVNGKTFAAVGASRRKDLQALIDVTRKHDFRFVRVEPAPWALLRTAAANKAGRVALRLQLNGTHLVATLVCGPQALLWRSIELTGDAEASADVIVSLVRTFESYASQQLGATTIDAVLLGGPGSKELGPELAADLGEKFSVVDGPGPTAAAVARGLALGGLERDKPAPDLARPLAPPPQLWDLVPRGEVALLGAVVICMGLWLWSVGTIAQNKAVRAEEENAHNALLQVDDGKLKDEKKVLSAQVAAVTTFLNKRVLWTEYLNQLSNRIPPGVKFVTFQGDDELVIPGKGDKKAKKGLLLNFSATVPRDLSAPPEVDELLEGIRSAPAVLRDFPDVKLSTLRINKSNDPHGRKQVLGDPATFTVTCLPKNKGGGARRADKKGGGAGATGGGTTVARSD
jgi:hypothetical protein